jgi:tetratricopeptide (TPR) repeat protein/transglutaminase-like putative cysteine protease
MLRQTTCLNSLEHPLGFWSRLARLLIVCGFALTSFRSICLTAQASDEPWNGLPFSSDPAVMLRSASALAASDKADALMVLDEVSFTFDADGKLNLTRRLVFLVTTPAGAHDWSRVRAEWEPWHQEKPSIRARVITPDGVAHQLDQKTLTEGPAGATEAETLTDRRALEAPLPAIGVGSVVEEETIVRDTGPLFEGGIAYRVVMSDVVPVHQSRVVVDAPRSLPLRYTPKLLSSDARRTESGERVRLTFESGPLDALTYPPPLLPGDVSTGPEVYFATGKSWQDVAARYAAVIDGQIRGSDMKSILPPVVGKNGSREAIAGIVAALHREVRYTGIEFGEAALVPRTPAETLKEKYGDCKDKAALLVAMLRASGIPSYVALLSVGPGRDVEPDLPGMGPFNHAIVYVPGPPEIWIDATAEFAPTGSLPWQDQGRLALIVRPETRVLIHTPESTSEQNRTSEVREFLLSEEGPAHVTEKTELSGVQEEGYRSAYSASNKEKIRGRLEDYVKREYLAEEVGKLEYSDSRDFSKPYRLEIEMPRAGRGKTDSNEAVVAVVPKQLLRSLPSYFTEDPEQSANDGEAEPSNGSSKEKKKRDADFVLPFSYTYELHYRIVPPPGFKALPVPQSAKTNLGPSIFTKEFAIAPDGTVSISLRFDTVKRRLTPQEADDLRAGVREIGNADPILVHFQQIGQVMLAKGEIREALLEFRSLAARHPKESLHHRQISLALLAAGIGDQARTEAKKAVELEPSSESYRNFGWVLEHDLVGRIFEKGMDLDGATAAYRKATEIDPSNAWLHCQFGIILEYNARGIRSAPDSRMDEAIKQYRMLSDQQLQEQNFTINLAYALLYTHRFNEMPTVAAKLDQPNSRSMFALAASAATGGSAGAIRKAAQEIADPGSRRSVLLGAADLLMKARMYPEAADLFAAGAEGSSNAAGILTRADLLRHAHRHEEMEYPETDPRNVVLRLMAISGGAYASDDVLFSLFSQEYLPIVSPPDALEPVKGSFHKRGQNAIRAGFLPDVAVDVSLAALRITSEGDDQTGYRVRYTGPSPLGTAGTIQGMAFVIPEHGEYRVDGLRDWLTDMGERALGFAEKGDLAKARRLLDWARDEIPSTANGDPLSGAPFAGIWTKGQAGDRDAIRFAAASLMTRGAPALRAIPILNVARKQASTEQFRNSFDLALATIYENLHRDEEDELAVTGRLLTAVPNSDQALMLHCNVLLKLDRPKECAEAAEDRLKRLPDDPTALRNLAFSADRSGQWEKSQDYWQRLLTSGKPVPDDWNNAAWDALMGGNATPKAIEQAQRATLLSQNNVAPFLHTLAALYAEASKTTEARAVLLQAMQVAGLEEPNSDYWYVFGRIAEQFGESDAARAYYRKVTPPEGLSALNSTYTLAQRRLAILGREHQP